MLQASALGGAGEILILDMGEPVKVVDLVRDLIRLSSLEPDVGIAIEYSGVRPGEKLVEQLMSDKEIHGETSHHKIFVARPTTIDGAELDRAVEQLIQAALRSDGVEIRKLLGVASDPATALAKASEITTRRSIDRALALARASQHLN